MSRIPGRGRQIKQPVGKFDIERRPHRSTMVRRDRNPFHQLSRGILCRNKETASRVRPSIVLPFRARYWRANSSGMSEAPTLVLSPRLSVVFSRLIVARCFSTRSENSLSNCSRSSSVLCRNSSEWQDSGPPLVCPPGTRERGALILQMGPVPNFKWGATTNDTEP